MKLSVIIPVFNEELTIEEVIQKVNHVDLGPVFKEIVVVNDGSTDQTRQILQKYKDHSVVKVFHLNSNVGKTAALVKGIFFDEHKTTVRDNVTSLIGLARISPRSISASIGDIGNIVAPISASSADFKIAIDVMSITCAVLNP